MSSSLLERDEEDSLREECSREEVVTARKGIFLKILICLRQVLVAACGI